MGISEKIICWSCNSEIVQYDHDGYKGKRGRCPICGVDFPLEWTYFINSLTFLERSPNAFVTSLSRMVVPVR